MVSRDASDPPERGSRALGLGERVRRGRLGFGKVRRVQAWQERGAPPGGRGESTGQAAGAGSQGSPPAPAAGSPGSGGTSGTPGVTPGRVFNAHFAYLGQDGRTDV